jgi:hypothetical protein
MGGGGSPFAQQQMSPMMAQQQNPMMAMMAMQVSQHPALHYGVGSGQLGVPRHVPGGVFGVPPAVSQRSFTRSLSG